jgi:hypothetical protein
MSTVANIRIAKTTVCDSRQCRTGNLLVRGTHIEFVSVEQVRRVGRHKLDYYAMPSDVVIPAEFVLVQDTSGELLRRCDFYIVRAKKGGGMVASPQSRIVLHDAQEYFGNGSRMPSGNVDIPNGPWHRLGKVQFIRYRRWGHAKAFYEHEYSPTVVLEQTARGAHAWRLPLPGGCQVDSRGFGWP